MYERTYGSKYAKGMDIKEIAKLVREDIKTAEKNGDLGVLPDGIKFSVRIDRYAGGQSLDVKVLDAPDDWAYRPADEYDKARNPYAEKVLTDEVRHLGKTLAAIVWAYNHDGSEVQVDYFDVNFYSTIYLGPGGLCLA